MKVAIASEAWNNPKTLGMYLHTRAILEAARSAGVDAYPLPLASHYGARVGGLAGPLFQQLFRGYGVPDLVHQTSLSVRRGVGVAMVQDLYPFQGRRLADRFFVWQTGTAVRRARRVIVTTEWMRAELARRFPRFEAKFRVIPLPHATPPLDRLPPSGYEALWLGRLAPNKDPGLYLELAAAYPAVRFAMRASPSPGREELAGAVHDRLARLPNVTDVPPFSEEEKDRQYRSTPIFVSTSRYEGFQAPAMEGYLRGMKLVLPTIPPFSELFPAGDPNVFWYESGNLASLVETFGRARSADARAPSARVVDSVSFATVGAKLKALYEEAS